MKKTLALLLFLCTALAIGQSANSADPLENFAVRLDEGGLADFGTVSSVGLSAPAEFAVSGSPIVTFGTLTLDWVGGVLPWLSPNVFFVRDDFIGLDGGGQFFNSVSGTGAVVTRVSDASSTIPGIIRLETGTTATGFAGRWLGFSSSDIGGRFSLGGGAITWNGSADIDNLSDGTESFIYIAGLCDLNSADCTDGVYFEYDQTGSTFWRIKTASNGTRTTVATANTVTADQRDNLKIICNAAATSCSFFIGGTEVSGSPITTNIPSGAARGLTVVAGELRKTVGITSRFARLDYCLFAQQLTTAR